MNFVFITALGFATCHSAGAIKLHELPSAIPKPRPSKVVDYQAFESESLHVLMSLPLHVTHFRNKWQAYHKSFLNNSGPIPQGALFVGVFSVQQAEPYTQVIRETWMKHPGVCPVGDGPKKGCSLYVAFVYGLNKTDYEKSRSRPDELILNIEENMNNGKTLSFFKAALARFPWATRIAKMDMDVFPKIRPTLEFAFRKDCAANGDYDWFGSGCARTINWAKVVPNNTCICTIKREYMQGGFYGMSRELALQVTAPGGTWEQQPGGHEDLVTGYHIRKWSESTGNCVSFRNCGNEVYLHPHHH